MSYDEVILTESQSFTRPSDTTQYGLDELVANSTTAGDVVPLTFSAHNNMFNEYIRRIRLTKTGTSVTSASFRVHFYGVSPTCANGDNAAFSTNQAANYYGAFDVTIAQAFTDGASGQGIPVNGSEINLQVASGQKIYALIQAKGTYTPASAEVFTVTIEMHRF